MPGGRINEGEYSVPFSKLISREVKEELGGKVKYLLGEPILYSRRYLRKKEKHIFTVVHSAEYLSGEITLSPEHSSFQWINPKTYKFKEKEFISKEEYLAFKKYFNSLSV